MKAAGALLLRLAHPSLPVRNPDIRELNACFTRVLPLAETHRVSGWLAHRLESAPDGLDADLRSQLVRARHRNALTATRARQELHRILAAFQSQDIPCIPFKGIDLAFRLYPDPGLRPFEDLDLLIPPHCVEPARRILSSLGYAVPDALLPSAWVRRFHFHLPFVQTEHQTFVELHWSLADRHTLPASVTEDAWARSATAATGTLALPDDLYLLYLLVHLAKHGCLNERLTASPSTELALHPWSDLRLIWFIDLHLLMERSGIPDGQVIGLARAAGIEQPVRTTLALMNRLLLKEDASPPPARKEGLIERRIKDRLVEQMTHDLEGHSPFPRERPRVLRTNKHLHIRPIRFFSHGP